ncbi:MAG: RimK family alpha-L-glutamate ligase, partial [Planctomycetia bacterium]|nr:RimK family alpha-L-glutamate ligase [Planctomycetia bacterium]
PAAVAAADVVVVRGMPGTSPPQDRLEEVVFRMDLLARLAAGGTPVVNAPRALEIAIDKYLSLDMLCVAGVPVPRTVVLQNPGEIEPALERLGGEGVLKPLFGSRGRGVERVSLAAGATSVAAGSESGRVFYLQEFIPNAGFDIRILVVGDRLFAMRRIAAAGEWRTNVSLGGRPEPFEPPAAWCDLARRAAATVGTEVAGVDLLPAKDGRVLVLEVNAVPGWQGLEAASGQDVTGAVTQHLEMAAKRGC